MQAAEELGSKRGGAGPGHAGEKKESREVLEFRKIIEEVMSWLSFQVLSNLDYKKLNRKGQRRCVQAKKDLFRGAATLHFGLGLPMTNCSLFFRGINFEVKHMNSFGVSDEDMASYAQLLEADK